MASEEDEVRSLLLRHRFALIRDLDETNLMPVLLKKGVLNITDEEAINSEKDTDKKCDCLIDAISQKGFYKFKEFCYAIEAECPQLITDIINDRLKYDGDEIKDGDNDIELQSGRDTIDSSRSRRSTSYCGSITPTPIISAGSCRSSIVAPSSTPQPQLPFLQSLPSQASPSSLIIAPHPQRLNQNDFLNIQQQQQQQQQQNGLLKIVPLSAAGGIGRDSSNQSSPAVKKRERNIHRHSMSHRNDDYATFGGRARKQKPANRQYHSMNETIEVLADPVIEDDPLGERTSWEYHTVTVTRVPGYGFGIAVSGGRDNPHFANGDPSIAVSDVLKGGPAEDRLQVNDRIISVNGVSLENVEYATAVQVLRDSGNTVTLVVKRRVANLNIMASPTHSASAHQHSHSLSSAGLGNPINNSPSSPLSSSQQTIKLVLSKSSKKDDFGIVLGCRLFIKEISSKARDQLATNGYSLQEGDTVSRIHNTNCNETMSLKEAKKIIDGCKERLNLVVLRDVVNNAATSSGMQSPAYSHTAQISNCSNIDENYLPGGSSYSAQNLYVQPPTRPSMNSLLDDKSNLTPRGRSRGPLMDVSLSQLDRPSTPPAIAHARSRSGIDEPPRPPPPRNSGEDFYSSRRQLYDDDPLQRSKQSAEPRFISFQKEGSVGIRLTGGNEAGIFVTAVQPGSPASLQGLTPGDKILKVNDMDMHSVTREEAVLFLLSLQDRIDLIVQHCKEEYDSVVANQRGDSFHIKTHFHCDNPSKGEMSFKAGDVFRVIDTLHNGVVGSWQVLRIGRGHQEMQRGVIPNKSRAEELATAQFNATKKEMNASESRGNFFRRRRSTHRRSKSLSRENWDDVVFSDSISKFPAYERVVLRHPGFVRPVCLFGPVADLARERLMKDFPDKFTAPLQDDDKGTSKCGIVRLSNIRDIMDRGKHALLDITPNAVDRLNYAQFYPIVIFLKADTKHIIKQLRHGIPKSAHKSSKKLLEQCQKLEKVWSHVFSTSMSLTDVESWYRKLRDIIDQQQSGAVWMSETKPVESLSDDFLFPMTTSRLSYASSPESDLELSPGPSASLSLGNLPQLVKSSSDPSIATNQDNLDRDRELNLGEGMPPPYTNHYDHAPSSGNIRRQPLDNKYGFSQNGSAGNILGGPPDSGNMTYASTTRAPPPIHQGIYGTAPDLPPRVDRASKPPGGVQLPITSPITSGPKNSSIHNIATLSRSAQERLFGSKSGENSDGQDEYSTRNQLLNSADKRVNGNSLERTGQQTSLDRPRSGTNGAKNNGSYDSVSSYDSYNTTQMSGQNIRLGPNAPDDLKSVPNVNGRTPSTPGQPNDYRTSNPNELIGSPTANRNPQHEFSRAAVHELSRSLSTGPNDLNRQSSPGRGGYHPDNSVNNGRNLPINPLDQITPRNANIQDLRSPAGINIPQRPTNLGLDASPRKLPFETKTDYGKYSRNNSATQADYKGGKSPQVGPPPSNAPFKPVPPPKPKNYRPPIQGGGGGGGQGGVGQMNSGQWDNGEPTTPRSPNGYGGFYPPNSSHYHHSSQNPPTSPMGGPPQMHSYNQYGSSGGGGGGNSNHFNNSQSAPFGNRGDPMGNNGYNGNHSYNAQYMHRGPGFGNIPHHPSDRHALDLAGSREQRGSAFELYRKPQISTASHHHNLSGMEAASSIAYANAMNEHQLYRDSPPPPPAPPLIKPKRKLLKSPLAAIKNAFMKTTKPLRRQSSLAETDKKTRPSVSVRRQHSMMEPRMYAAARSTPPHFHHHQQQQQPIYYQQQQNLNQSYRLPERHEPFYPQDFNGTYQNLQYEPLYDNRAQYRRGYHQVEQQDHLYANRALIDLEQRISHRPQRGGIIRRHSLAERPSHAFQFRRNNDYDQQQQPVELDEPIYQTRGGSYMMHQEAPFSNSTSFRQQQQQQQQQNLRNMGEPIYHSRREMHRDHLYQSKKEMQERIHQGRKEIERATSDPPSESSSYSSQGGGGASSRDPSYVSRRELKENSLRTRAQLRDHIYQTRREAMESMAEPVYVSRKDIKHEPIYETKELETNETSIDVSFNLDMKREEAEGAPKESISPECEKSLTKSGDRTVIEVGTSKQSKSRTSGSDDEEDDDEDDESDTLVSSSHQTPSSSATENDTLTAMSPKLNRVTHISNIIKRTAPQPPPPNLLVAASMTDKNIALKNLYASRTSIETQYTSQASLPSTIGPPNASSTPYASDLSLGIVMPVPILPREPTTTRGIFDEHGGTLSDNVWNVSLHIPPGAIASGVRQEIYFTVTDPRLSECVGGPPLDMENGETMLSPLVMCGPQGLDFLVPVTLNIPHCAGRTTSLGLALKATDSEKDLKTNWDNIELPSNTAAHTVSVKVDHF